MRISSLFEDKTVRQHVANAEAEAVERYNRLTKRQKQILLMIADGLLNKQTAQDLGISQRTVENHRLELMDRVGVKTMSQLIRLSILAGDP
jgi:two-component system CheB/CheR fusion protein